LIYPLGLALEKLQKTPYILLLPTAQNIIDSLVLQLWKDTRVLWATLEKIE
jgi:hypothetical protein